MKTFSRQLLRKWAILMEIIGLVIGIRITLGKFVEGSSMNYGVNPYSLDELAVSEIKMLEYLIHNADEQLNVEPELAKIIDT